MGKTPANVGFPDWAIVPPNERRHVGRACFLASTAIHGNAPLPHIAIGRAGIEMPGQHPRDGETEGPIVERSIEEGVLKRKGNHVVARQLEIDGRAHGITRREFRAVAHTVVRQVGLVGRRVGQGPGDSDSSNHDRRARGLARASPRIREQILHRVLRRVAARERKAKALVDGYDPREIKTRVNLVGLVPRRSGCFFQLLLRITKHQIRTPVEHRLRTFEGSARHHVHAARERRARRLRRWRVIHFDPRDVVDRNLLELDGAARARRRRAGKTESANRHRHVVRRRAAERDRARIATTVVHADTGNKFQKLTDVALRHVAELVRRNDVDHVGRKALLVNRDCGAIHLLRGPDFKLGEFHHPGVLVFDRGLQRRIETEVTLHGGTVGHDDRLGLHIQTREKYAHLYCARRHAREAILARRIGERLDPGALDREARLLKIFAVAGVEDAALDRAPRGRLGQCR